MALWPDQPRYPLKVGRVRKLRETPDALRFFAQLQERTSVAACADLFRETVAKFGIHAFACGEIDLADRSRNVMFIAEWPKAWVRYYLKSGLVDHDPILNAASLPHRLFVQRHPSRSAILEPRPRDGAGGG